MIRLSYGWYVMLADLALILFMVTAQAVHDGEAHMPAGNPLPAEGEPVAIYRTGNGAPPLRQWLAAEAQDQRLRLTVIARYTGADAEEAALAAARLAADAGDNRARVVIEPGDRQELLAVLAYDQGPTGWHGDCSARASKENSRCK